MSKEVKFDGEMYSNYNGGSYLTEVAIDFIKELNLYDFYSKDSEIEILDLGSCTGLLCSFMLEYFPKAQRIVGLDISDSMIEYSKKYNSGDAIIYRKYNIGDPEIANIFGKFDLVLSTFAINWCENQDAIFSNINCLLKRGGHFINVMNIANNLYMESALEKLAAKQSWRNSICDYKASLKKAENWKRSSNMKNAYDYRRELVAHTKMTIIDFFTVCIRCDIQSDAELEQMVSCMLFPSSDIARDATFLYDITKAYRNLADWENGIKMCEMYPVTLFHGVRVAE